MPKPMSREEARERVRKLVHDVMTPGAQAEFNDQFVYDALEALPPEVLLAFCGAEKPDTVSGQERIEESAVKCEDRIYTGKRHADCICEAIEAGESLPIRMQQQGFVTNTGRFVTREEAWDIAVRAGQLKARPLTSEDLW